MLSIMQDMADKTNLCSSDPRFQEMLSFMTEKTRRDMKQRMEEDFAAIREEVSTVGASSKKNDEAQEKMEQLSFTSLAGKRCEDKKKNEAGEFLGTKKCMMRHEASRQKKKLSKASEEEKS